MSLLNYNRSMLKFDYKQDFVQIKNFIEGESLNGGDITMLMDDIHKHLEIADSFNWDNSKEYYSDLLSRLIKTYGH